MDVGPIDIWLNFSNPDIQKIILTAVEAVGTSVEVEYVRKTLKVINGVIKVQLHKLVVDAVYCLMTFLKITIKIQIQKLIGKFIKNDVYRSTDTTPNTYLNGLVKDAEYKVEVEHVYKIWITTRNSAIKSLKAIVIELTKTKRNTNIIRFTGATVSATTFVAVATIATGGAALPLAAVAFSLCGAATSLGAKVLGDSLSKGGQESANKMVEKYQKDTDNLLELLKRYKQQTKDHLAVAYKIDELILRFQKVQGNSRKVTLRIGNSVEEEIGYKKVNQVSGQIGQESMKCLKRFNVFDNKTTNKTRNRRLPQGDSLVMNEKPNNLLTVAKGGAEMLTRVAGTVKTVGAFADEAISVRTLQTASVATKVSLSITVAAFALDVYTVYNTAMSMAKGSPDKAAQMIEEVVTKLENEKIPELNDFIVDTKLEAAKERGIHIEGLTD